MKRVEALQHLLNLLKSKPSVLHVNSPVIVHADDTPEAMRMTFCSTQAMLFPGGHRLRAYHSLSVAKRQNEPVRPMEVE